MATEECPVGCERYTAANPCITCPHCHAGACQKCQKTYLLGASLDPHCMECKRGWTPDIIASLFSESFRKGELRKKVIQLLAEREKAYFPETLETAHRSRSLRLFDEARKDVARERRDLRNLVEEYRPITPEEVEKYNKAVRTFDEARATLNAATPQPEQEQEQPRERRAAVRPCPAHGCNGFLSTAWKCAACHVHVCNTCEEVKDASAEHTCDPDMAATVELKRKDAKPCPHCGVFIHKTSGCNQMWCIHCKTAFDWSSGRIMTGVIHNPHYFEWRDRQHRTGEAALVDNPCAGGWNWDSVRGMFPTMPQNHPAWVTMARMLQRMREIDAQETNNNYAYTPELYRALRERRVLGELTDAQWCKRLSALETTRKRKETLHQIDMAMLAAARDLVQRGRAGAATLEETLAHLEALRVLTNEQRVRVAEDTTKTFVIADTWRISWVHTTE